MSLPCRGPDPAERLAGPLLPSRRLPMSPRVAPSERGLPDRFPVGSSYRAGRHGRQGSAGARVVQPREHLKDPVGPARKDRDSPRRFRASPGHFASGVTIITTRDAEGRPTGLTASAFSSVSLSRPLILVCVDDKPRATPRCAPAAASRSTSWRSGRRPSRTASPPPWAAHDKFDGVPHRISELGLPLLDGALAHLECSTVHAYAEGDHTIFVGRVEAGERPRRARASPCSTSAGGTAACGRPAGSYRDPRSRCPARPSTTRSSRRCWPPSTPASTSSVPQCREFEEELARYVGVRHAVLEQPATAALWMTLRALGVKAGDEILVPSHTAFPTVEAICSRRPRPSSWTSTPTTPWTRPTPPPRRRRARSA